MGDPREAADRPHGRERAVNLQRACRDTWMSYPGATAGLKQALEKNDGVFARSIESM